MAVLAILASLTLAQAQEIEPKAPTRHVATEPRLHPPRKRGPKRWAKPPDARPKRKSTHRARHAPVAPPTAEAVSPNAGDAAKTASAVQSSAFPAPADESPPALAPASPPAGGPPPFAFGLGLHAFSRSLHYSGDGARMLPSYDLDGAPALANELEWFPCRSLRCGGALSHIALFGTLEYAIGIDSQAPGIASETLSTRSYGYAGGVRLDVPVSARSSVGAVASYGRQVFEVVATPGPTPKPNIPSVSYRELRLGGGGRLGLGRRAALGVELAYLVVLSSGEIESAHYFPRLDANGMQAIGYVGFDLVSDVEVRLGIDARRYSIDTHATSAMMPTGASDDYLSGELTFLYRFGG
jgi:hypothetical protein